jgi:hypothetical protein
MAVISPVGLVGARSPILITWDGTGTAASDIRYFKLEIYAWSGEETAKPATPIYTIDRQSGFVDAYPTADIAPLLEAEFNSRISKLSLENIVDNAPDAQLWVQVDYDIEYIDDPFVVNDTGSTDVFIATYGYGKFTEGANKNIQRPILQQYERYAADVDAFMMSIYLGLHGEGLDIKYGYRDRVIADGGTIEALNCCNFGLDAIRVLNDDGTAYEYQPTEADVYGTAVEERVMLFPAGPANLTNFKEAQGYTGTAPYRTNYYDIQLLDVFDNVIESMRVYNTCEARYEPVSLYFVNRYGAWDNITFFKRSDTSLNVSKDTYRSTIGSASSSGYTWGNQARGMRTYNHKAQHRLTLNTGFVNETYSEVIEQLLMSEYVLAVIDRSTARDGQTFNISQSQRAVNILTDTLTLQKHVNDKTINYTIDVEYATPENAML